MANLEAAKVCNHKRTISKTWKSSLEKKKERIKVLRNRARIAQAKIKKRIKDWTKKHEERLNKQQDRLRAAIDRLEKSIQQMKEREKQGKDTTYLKKRIKIRREAVVKQKQRIKDIKIKQNKRIKKLKEGLQNRQQRDNSALEKMKLKINIQKETKDYNISTSLKSYIDPRIYYEWSKQVEYDWKKYYAKSLHKKFSWLDCQDNIEEN
jgi:DNA topoisomerase-1